MPTVTESSVMCLISSCAKCVWDGEIIFTHQFVATARSTDQHVNHL